MVIALIIDILEQKDILMRSSRSLSKTKPRNITWFVKKLPSKLMSKPR